MIFVKTKITLFIRYLRSWAFLHAFRCIPAEKAGDAAAIVNAGIGKLWRKYLMKCPKRRSEQFHSIIHNKYKRSYGTKYRISSQIIATKQMFRWNMILFKIQ